MTNGSDRPSGPDEPGTPDAGRPAADEPTDDRSPGSRLGTENQADPLEELRRRQYTERQARERRDEERRQREQAEREARERRERERRDEERRRREQAEREARERRERERRDEERRQREERGEGDAAAASESSRSGGESGAPRGVTEPPGVAPSRSGPNALRRPRPSLPGDPRGTRRPEGKERGAGGDETRPLPSVESGAPSERPPDPSRQRPSDVPPLRKPWERPAPAGFSSPGSRGDERAQTRPEPAETRPMQAPGPSRPQPRDERPKEPTAEVTEAVGGAQEAAIPRLDRVPSQGPVRRRITGVDARSIFKLALAFYLGILITVIAGGTALWFVLTAAGVIGNLESFLGELLGYEDFQFIFSRIIVVLVLVGLVWVVLSAAVTALFATIYNRASRFTGGLGISLDEDA